VTNTVRALKPLLLAIIKRKPSQRGQRMCDITDAEQQLKQLQAEFRSIQERLRLTFNPADIQSLVKQGEAILADARILCSVFNIAQPSWMQAAKRAIGK
jgi:hypothetical protein